MKKFAWRKCRKTFLEAIFSHSRKLFSKFSHKIFSLFYVITLVSKISYCLSVNHNPELRCVICTGVSLFALVLRLNCTALSQSESSNFIMYITISNKGQTRKVVITFFTLRSETNAPEQASRRTQTALQNLAKEMELTLI